MKAAKDLPGGERDKHHPMPHLPTFDKVSALIGHQQLPRIDQLLEEYGPIHGQLCKVMEHGLGFPAPPAESLRKIQVWELQPSAIAKGCCIHGTIAAHSKRIFRNAAALVLEDSTGDHAFRLLAFNSVHSEVPDEKFRNKYPQGAKVVLKEPKLITRDSLSENLRRRLGDVLQMLGRDFMVIANPEALEVLSYVPDVACGDSTSLKQLGTVRFKAGNFQAAAELYTRSLELTSSDDERLVALSNRAEANLQLGKLSEALGDANSALEIGPAHAKSCSRKARALRGLHQYVDSCDWFNKAMEFSGPDEASKAAARASYEKSRRLKLQSVEGTHDLSGFIRSGFIKQYPEEFAEFVGPVEIRRSELRGGRGLFVTSDAHIGQLLLVSRAVMMNCNQQETGDGEFISMLAEASERSPRLRAQFYALASWSDGMLESKPPVSIDIFKPNTGVIEPPELDVSRITDTWCRNREIPNLGFVKHLSGLYPVTGLINFSCLPNVSLTEIGMNLFVFAARDLRAGEELVRIYEGLDWCSDVGWYCERCSVISSLGDPMQTFIGRYKKALRMGDVHRGRMFGGGNPEQVREFTRVALLLEKVLQSPIKGPSSSSGRMLSEEKKNWVRVSFSNAYWTALLRSGACPGLPPALNLLKAVRAVVSGGPGVLKGICAMLAYFVRSQEWEAAKGVAEEECKANFGSNLIQKNPDSVLQIMRFYGFREMA